MSSGLCLGVRRFSDARVFEWVLFTLEQGFEVEARSVAVFERVSAQVIERRLRQIAKPAKVGLLRFGEAAGILAEDGLNARFHLGAAFGRKLGPVRGVLRGA